MQLKGKLMGCLVFGLMLMLTANYAQEPLKLTLEQSVTVALERNPQIKMAEKELAKARAGIGVAYSNILPQVNGSANFQHAWEIQQNTIPNFLKAMLGPLAPMLPGFENMPDYVSISFGMENTFVYGVNLTQPLYLGGAGLAGVQMAYSARRAAEQNLELSRQNLIFQTVSAFYGCLLTQEIVSVQTEALAQAQANLDMVLKKYQVGAASGFDKMRAEVEVANLRPEVISAKNNYQAAITQLRMILGLEKEAQLDIEGQFEYVEDQMGLKSLSEIQALSIERRPEMQAFNEQKYITQKGITLARSNFMPKLFFQTDYSYLAMKDNLKIAQKDFNRGFTSAVSLQIPLFHGLKSMREYQQAKLDYKITLDSEKQIHDGLFAESEMVYHKFQEAQQKYLSARDSESLAKEALRLANMMYQEGANTQLDVLSSQLALTRAKLNYVLSLYEYELARYQLRRVTGTLKQTL